MVAAPSAPFSDLSSLPKCAEGSLKSRVAEISIRWKAFLNSGRMLQMVEL